jgi:UDP-glucose 4-epimerase
MSILMDYLRSLDSDTIISLQEEKNVICVIGGLQYIGAHVTLEFLNNNYTVIVMDQLHPSNFTYPEIFSTKYNRFKFIRLDYQNTNHIRDTLIHNKVNVIIYPFRNSFSYKDPLTMVCNTITPLTSIIKSINETNIASPKQIKMFICASTLQSQSSEIINYTNFNYTMNQRSFLTYQKERLVFDFHKMNSDIKTVILKITTPCGIDSLFFNSFLNIQYLKQHPSLQNNIIYSVLTDELLKVNKNQNYNVKYSDSEYTNSVNYLDIHDISNAFVKTERASHLNQFSVQFIYNYKSINILKIVRTFGTRIRFILGPYDNSVKVNDIQNLVKFTTKNIKWEPKQPINESFEKIGHFMSDKKGLFVSEKCTEYNNNLGKRKPSYDDVNDDENDIFYDPKKDIDIME